MNTRLKTLQNQLAILKTLDDVYDYNVPNKRLHYNRDIHNLMVQREMQPYLKMIKDTEEEIRQLEESYEQDEAVNQVNILLQQASLS